MRVRIEQYLCRQEYGDEWQGVWDGYVSVREIYRGHSDEILGMLGFFAGEIPFLQSADSLLISHFQQSIQPTIARIEALLPPEVE